MAERNNWDSPQAFLLSECYELALRYESSDTARDVLRIKSKKTGYPSGYVPSWGEPVFPESPGHIISSCVSELTAEVPGTTRRLSSSAALKVSKLPPGAEKEYTLALIALSAGTSQTQRAEALRHLSAALSYAPNDPRCIALANVLQEAGV